MPPWSQLPSTDAADDSTSARGNEQDATLHRPGRTLLRPEKTRLRPQQRPVASDAVDATGAADRGDAQDAPDALEPADATDAPHAPIGVGTRIQRRYVLEERVGAGAMGQVWRARDLVREQARNPRSRVALKLLNAQCSEHPDAFVGLEREASKAQELAHPNIITVHTFDYDPDLECAFIIMEYLEGRSLDSVMRRAGGGVPRKDALPIIEGVLDGLAYAHKKGVVHCDLKPGNIFLTADGVPKILDFGIARAVRREGVAADDAGFRGYTPGYASAELAREEDPTPADDVYALGIVLYELLSGRHPFGREVPVEARSTAPAPLREIKKSEWRAIERALASERARRWSDAGAMRQAFRGRSRLSAILAATTAVFAVVAAGAGYENWRASQPDVPLARLPASARAAFGRDMKEADRAWRLLEKGQSFVFEDALDGYESAFRIHPRDHAAEAGLERVADYAIARAESSRSAAKSLALLESLQERSRYLRTYRPLERAIARQKQRVSGE